MLKIVAIVAMTLDHIGYFIYDPSISYSYEIYLVFRIVGRISMPIFCFMIAEGFRKTKDQYRYAARLAVAALVSEIPYNLCFFGSPIAKGSLNVMFSLLLGLLGLIFYKIILEKTKLWIVAVLPIVPICLATHFLGADYGLYAPLLIFLFYLASNANKKAGNILTIIITVLFGLRDILQYVFLKLVSILFLSQFEPSKLTDWSYIQIFSMLSVCFLLLYDGRLGRIPENKLRRLVFKYSFYLFYPLHLIIFWLVFRLICRQ